MRWIVSTLLFVLLVANASAQSNRPSSSSGGSNQQPKPVTQPAQQQTSPDLRGTENAPVIVKVLEAPKSEQEAAQEKADRQDVSSANWWMVRLTGVLGLIGIVQAGVFWIQAGRLKETIKKMDEIARGQTADMQSSIQEWKRVAGAMEGVASAMGANVVLLRETVTSAKENVATAKRIADQQELIGKLQTRAFLAVEYVGVVPQNNATLYKFEPRIRLNGSGLTPAYKVRFRAAADVLAFPLPDDFAFPLPDPVATASAGMLGPRNSFILSAVAPRMYSDPEIAEIRAGVSRRLYIWGIVSYEDAFQVPRSLKFSQSIVWLADGTNTMSFNTARHNDAD